jgi:hypothetical protein
MYRARWERNGDDKENERAWPAQGGNFKFDSKVGLGGGVGEEDGLGLLGTLDFEESRRNIVFRNVNRMSEEEWERERERKSLGRVGYVVVWIRRMLAGSYFS